MPRQLRIQYPGAIYHVLSRGDRREKIFLDDVDRQDWHGKNRAERIIAEELATLSAPLLVSALTLSKLSARSAVPVAVHAVIFHEPL